MDIIVFALTALTLILTLTALAVPLARKLHLPLPVVIAAVGLIAGTVSEVMGFELSGTILDTYDLWFVAQLAADPEALLYIFLPPLLFEMALNVNVRRLLDDVTIVLVMAILAVAVATAMVGMAVWWLSPLSLVACLLLAAAIATTDPGAVIATFREIGAPRRLQVVLEGESLLNDAAAIAIFTLLLAAISADVPVTLSGFSIGFLLSFAGGGAVGLGMSFVAAWVYPFLGRSIVAETSLTLAMAYATYLTAEQVFAASGVVAVVIAGMTTGSWGFVRMGPRNWATVSAVWTQIGFWANALILLLVALMTPGVLLGLTREQALLVPLIYIGAIAARAVILYGVLPALNRIGLATPINAPQKALILWGGVRGSVTLVLALSLTNITRLGDDAAVIGALAAAFTLMTLILNASTLALMTHWLKLDQLSRSDVALRERIVAGAIERVRNVVVDLASQRQLEPAALADVAAALGRQRREAEAHARGETIAEDEQLRLGLTILSGQEARLIRRAFEDAAIGPRTTNRLRLAADRIADGARIGGRVGYQKAFETNLYNTRKWRIALAVRRFLKWDRPLRKLIEFSLTDLLETERTLRELDRFAESTLMAMIGSDATLSARSLVQWRLALVRQELQALGLQYPHYFAALERVLITRAALRRERHQYERLFADGVIESELRDDLIRDMEQRERRAAEPPKLDLHRSPDALLEKVQHLARLEPAQRRLVAQHLKTRFAVPGEIVVRKDSNVNAVMFVASGVLDMRGTGTPKVYASGDVIGAALLTGETTRFSADLIARGYCRLLCLPRRDLNRLKRRDPRLHAMLQSAAEESDSAQA